MVALSECQVLFLHVADLFSLIVFIGLSAIFLRVWSLVDHVTIWMVGPGDLGGLLASDPPFL